MLKRELVNEVAQQLGDYYKQDISQAVDIILEEISQALTEDRRVEIRGFGSFSVRTRKPRTTKNPKTGKMMNIPARKTLHFTMSKSLKEELIDDETA
jgi:integration host factor subunit beta